MVNTESDVLQSGLQPDKPGIAALCWWRADGAGGLSVHGSLLGVCSHAGAGARIGSFLAGAGCCLLPELHHVIQPEPLGLAFDVC